MNVLIVGASTGLGRCLAEEAAMRGHHVLLSSTDSRDLIPLAAHLRLCFEVQVAYCVADICVQEDRCRLVREASLWRPVDAVLLPLGASRPDDMGSLDDLGAQRLINVNFFGQTCLLNAIWPGLREQNPAYIIGFGSIAAIRGRRRNVIYAAAKRALESYFESLRAMSAGTGISVQLYHLGYMKTQQTFGKKLLLPVASPQRVAAMVFDRLGQARNTRYYPGWWRWIGAVLRRLPWALYSRLDF